MRDVILRKATTLPKDEVLAEKQVVVEHWLRGNEDQTKPLAQMLIAKGKSARVDPLEIGTVLVIQDRPQTFRRHAASRISAICAFAERHRLKYESWWLFGDHFSDYVSQ